MWRAARVLCRAPLCPWQKDRLVLDKAQGCFILLPPLKLGSGTAGHICLGGAGRSSIPHSKLWLPPAICWAEKDAGAAGALLPLPTGFAALLSSPAARVLPWVFADHSSAIFLSQTHALCRQHFPSVTGADTQRWWCGSGYQNL